VHLWCNALTTPVNGLSRWNSNWDPICQNAYGVHNFCEYPQGLL